MKRYSLLLVILVTILASCRRDLHEPFFGPKACPNEDFAIITPFTAKQSSYSKNIAGILNFRLKDLPFKKNYVDSLTISAKFNSAAVWRVEIIGQSSLAKKIYTAESDAINVVWYGRPTGDKFFMDEKIEIVFTVQCRPDLTQKVTYDLLASRFNNAKYAKGIYNPVINDPKVLVMENFDSIANPIDKWKADSAKDTQYGDAALETALLPINKFKYASSEMHASPQGYNFLSFIGTQPITAGPQKNTYGSYGVYLSSDLLKKLPIDRSRVWINFYASSGKKNPTKFVLDYRQEKTVCTDSCRIKTVRVGKQGSFLINPSDEWQRFSYNMNNLEVLDTPFDANKTEILFFTVVQSGGVVPTEFDIDFITFTIDEPFWGNEK